MLKWLRKVLSSLRTKITHRLWADSREIDYTSPHWGHTLHVGKNWRSSDKFDLTGHYFGRFLLHDKGIKEGDVLLIAMNGGKTGMLRVYSITWFRDPNDMFSATVMFEGVKDQ